jgi:ABC-2 type transport system permease protein
MVLWGFITRYLNTVTSSGFNFVPILLGAVLLWDFLVRVMQGVTMAFFEDVWSRNFLNIFATPLSISDYLIGLVLASVLTSDWPRRDARPGYKLLAYIFHLRLMLVPFLLVLFLFGIALGIFSSAVVLRLGPASEWFIWPIPALIAPFAGVFYPLSTLPRWMQYVSYLMPPSYVFEGMRTIISEGAVSKSELLWCGCLAGFYILFACWFFTRMYKHAVHTGLIARYSAETLS